MFFHNNKKENEKFLDMKTINEEKNAYIKSNYNTTLEDISFFLGLIGDGKISDERGTYFYSKF